MGYEVHLDVYDGPFELLLQLITGRELDLYEISLTEIVDAFVAEIKRIESVDLDRTTEFLLIAATLVELKCRRLLPEAGAVELDEDIGLFEARDYLLARLVECKMFSGAGTALNRLEECASRSRARHSGPDERFFDIVPDLMIGVTSDRLAEIARVALDQPPREVVSIAHVLVDEVSVSELVTELEEVLPRCGRTKFRDLLGDRPSPSRIVACFLALLELYKQERIELEQMTTFGALTVAWLEEASHPNDGSLHSLEEARRR